MAKLTGRISGDPLETLKFALSASDTANAHAMRLWYAAALVSVPILLHLSGLGDVGSSLDANLKTSTLLPALLLILSVLNVIFVIAQVSHHRLATMYRSVVLETFSETDLAAEGVTWRDLALSAPIAGYNRIMPLLEAFGMKRGWLLTRGLRTGFNLAFGLFPVGTVILGLCKLPSSSPLFLAATIVGAVSFIASCALISYAYRGFKELGDIAAKRETP